MNDLRKFLIGIFWLVPFFIPVPHLNAAEPDDVVVIANINSPGSLELAQYYLKKRSIPEDNLILLNLSQKEEISNREFIVTIWNPLREELLKRGFIEGELSMRKKNDGRSAYYPFATGFRYLLLCKGVPLKIQNQVQVLTNPQQLLTIQSIFRTTQASVDSELSLIVTNNKAQISHHPNPIFQIENPSQFDLTNAISVCRIDGPTFETAKRIIDLSIEAEKTPLIEGRAYIDLYPPQHPDGNKWLHNAALLLRSYGFDVDVETSAKHWNITQRNDAPAIYLGWYQPDASGPAVTLPSIPPGSIAGHIHSLSARTLSDDKIGWAGPLIVNGFAVTFGNVYEPYLQMTLRPDLFLESLLKGHCIGDSSIFASPVLSWQNVTIGDPLYTPFPETPSFDPLEVINDPQTDSYTAIICINRLSKKNRTLAKDKAIEYFLKTPTVPIAYKILMDFGTITSPVIMDSLYDYMCTKQIESEEFVPLFLTIFDRLYKADDARCVKILDLLNLDSSRWSEPVTKLISDRTRMISSDAGFTQD